MSEIKWERASPNKSALRKGFDDLYAEFNGAKLYVIVDNSLDHGLIVGWGVSREHENMRVVGFEAFGFFVRERQLKKAYELAKKRAEAFARCWVEK